MQPSCWSVGLRFLHSNRRDKLWLKLCVIYCHCFPLTWFSCLPAAGNESCPQPQTSEHLAAIEIMKLKHILILQNKIDLVKESQAKEQYEQILAFVQGESLWTCNRHQTLIVSWNTATFSPFQARDSSGHFILPLTLCCLWLMMSCSSCRHGGRGRSHHSYLSTAEVQHRGGLWVHRQKDPSAHQRLHVRAQTHR